MDDALETTASVVRPSDSLISTTVALTSYEGAHPNTTRIANLMLLDGTQITKFSEVFAKDPTPIVIAAIKKQTADITLFPDWEANVGKLAVDLRHWSFAKGFATLMLDPYTIAAYVYGPQDVDIGYEILAPFLTAEFHKHIQ